MEINIKDSFWTIKNMEKARILEKMGRLWRENGSKMKRMEDLSKEIHKLEHKLWAITRIIRDRASLW